MFYTGTVEKGAGGASKAFVRNENSRINDISLHINETPFPGTLNLRLDIPFDWNRSHLNVSISDAPSWTPMPCRIYPLRLQINNTDVLCWAIRWEKNMNRYKKNFIEIVSRHPLRQSFNLENGNIVTVMHTELSEKNKDIRNRSDYQRFKIENDLVESKCPRLDKKLKSFSDLPFDFWSLVNEKKVLDMGCDFGFWSFTSALSGASKVVGLDRNRKVRGVGDVDIIWLNTEVAETLMGFDKCSFIQANLGKEWPSLEKFDIVLCMSMYHHVYAQCGDHTQIFNWISSNMNTNGKLLWEGPTTKDDGVVKRNMNKSLHDTFEQEMLSSASLLFDIEGPYPAVHEPTREMFLMTKKI
jgi:2-polyprenyl-3-methyl-5-hydroxy-6-metoxy-1,4-benzoquinol methylase